MPWGLRRYYGNGGLHFITCSCYQRHALLNTPARRDLLLAVLERTRDRYKFVVIGFVVMPEHVHLLISEPLVGNPSTVMQPIKLGFARRVLDSLDSERPHLSQKAREMGHPESSAISSSSRHVWAKRFYDFNVWSQRKEVEK